MSLIVECRGCPARIEVFPLEDRRVLGWCPCCFTPISDEERN